MQQQIFYTVNYMQERLDVVAMQEFANKLTAQLGYETLVAKLDSLDKQIQELNSIMGLGYIDEVSSRVASKNIIDYHFEAGVLASMNAEQIERYFSDIERCFSFASINGVGSEGPLWVDTVHHVCMFSVLARLGHYLIGAGRINHIVLIHRGGRDEPRLGVLKTYIANTYGVSLDLLRLSDNWLSSLGNIVTDFTGVLSMCDLPLEPSGLASVHRLGKNRKPNTVELYFDDTNSIFVECTSGSATFARRFNAHHVVMDYPSDRQVQIRPYDPDVAPRCPIDSWVFWPCLAGPERALI